MNGTTTVIVASTQFSNAPLTVALFFGLAGSFFFGIYLIRRIRQKNLVQQRRMIEEMYIDSAFKSGR